MFKELDLVRLKNGDGSVGVSSDEVATIVDVAPGPNGTLGYTLEFIDAEGFTNMDALHKYYTENEIEKVK